MVVSVWPNPVHVALAASMGVLGSFNTFINGRVIPRFGDRRGEIGRLVYNLVTNVPIFHVLGWPLASFVWIPFIALFTNNLDRRLARGIVLANGSLIVLAAVLDHVPPLVPLSFFVLAVVARITAESNVDALHALVDEAEAANERLLTEIAAREEAQRELETAHKMEALGRLAAGVAHEINTPIQFVGDSIGFAREAIDDVLGLFMRGRALVLECAAIPADVRAALEEAENRAELPFLVENLPLAMTRAEEGLARIANIVRSMKMFAHPGTSERTPIDVNQVIESALAVAHSEYRYVAEVERHLDPLPPILGRQNEINQVLLNLVVNAAHAVAERSRGDGASLGRISVRSRRDGENVVVEVSDTGAGIPEGIRDKIMDPFFTTKPVGRDTGQGLAIARTLVEAHGGSIAFESRVGRGTTFRVSLPANGG